VATSLYLARSGAYLEVPRLELDLEAMELGGLNSGG
jgi:hypothetical protein